MLAGAYAQKDRFVMEQDIREIIEVCQSTENKHFVWFARLLENHMDETPRMLFIHARPAKLRA